MIVKKQLHVGDMACSVEWHGFNRDFATYRMVTINEPVRQHSNPITEKSFGLPGEENSGLWTEKLKEVLYRLRRVELETPKKQQNSDED